MDVRAPPPTRRLHGTSPRDVSADVVKPRTYLVRGLFFCIAERRTNRLGSNYLTRSRPGEEKSRVVTNGHGATRPIFKSPRFRTVAFPEGRIRPLDRIPQKHHDFERASSQSLTHPQWRPYLVQILGRLLESDLCALPTFSVENIRVLRKSGVAHSVQSPGLMVEEMEFYPVSIAAGRGIKLSVGMKLATHQLQPKSFTSRINLLA